MAKTAPVVIPIIGDDKFTKKWKRIGKTVAKVGAGMQRVGQASMRYLTLPILAAGAAAAKVGSDFDFAMRKVEAKVNITGKSISELRNQAKELGRTTVHTAREVAGAQEKLAMAGWDSLQVFEALPSVLALSTAASTELIQTADIASNVMQTFGLRADESGRVADVFATIVAGANVDMEMLSETMKFAGPIAKSFGTSMEDTAAAAGFLGNMGIQGTLAGTALQNMMVNLAAPTAKAKGLLKEMGVEISDSSGNIRDLKVILSELAKGMEDVGQANRLGAIKEIFGKRAMKAAAPAIADVGKMDSSLKNLSKTLDKIKPGKAAAMVKIMTGGPTGAFKRFTSALEGMAIAFAESGLLDALAGIADNMAKMFKRVSELSPETKQLALRIALFAAAAGPALLVLGKIVSVVAPLIPLIAGAGGMSGAFAAVGAALTGPVGLAIIGAVAAFATLTAATVFLWDEIEPIRKAFAREIPAAFGLSSDEAGSTSEVFSQLGDAIKSLTKAFAPIGGVLVTIGVRLSPVVIWFKIMKFLLTPVVFILKHLFRIFSRVAKVIKAELEPRLYIAQGLFKMLKKRIWEALGPIGDMLKKLGLLSDKLDDLTKAPDIKLKFKTVGDVLQKEFGAYEKGMMGLEGKEKESDFEREYRKMKQELSISKTSKVEVSFKDLPKGTGVSKTGEVVVLSDTGPIMEGAI